MGDSLLRPAQLVEFVRVDSTGVTLVQMLPVRFLTAVRGGRARRVIFPRRGPPAGVACSSANWCFLSSSARCARRHCPHTRCRCATQRARRGPAREALTMEVRCYERGMADAWPAAELVSSMEQINPPDELRSRWGALSRGCRVGATHAQAPTALLFPKQVYKVSNWLHEWLLTIRWGDDLGVEF